MKSGLSRGFFVFWENLLKDQDIMFANPLSWSDELFGVTLQGVTVFVDIARRNPILITANAWLMSNCFISIAYASPRFLFTVLKGREEILKDYNVAPPQSHTVPMDLVEC